MYTIPNATPGTPVVRCIQVTYTGSLPADVHLYSSASAPSAVRRLTIDKGTGNTVFPNCARLSCPTQPNIFTGRSVASPRRIPTSPPARRVPRRADRVEPERRLVYRFTADLAEQLCAIGLTSGVHSFTWEAQNQ